MKEIYNEIEQLLNELGLRIVQKDMGRPWGGFFVIDETQASIFVSYFFPEEDFDCIKISEKLSPKILFVLPNKRLSWQYHHRRAEMWRCIEGPVAVITSNSDVETISFELKKGDMVKLNQGERHRLIGLATCGVIAEIWRHTDKQNPSDEQDIVRIQDDYGR